MVDVELSNASLKIKLGCVSATECGGVRVGGWYWIKKHNGVEISTGPFPDRPTALGNALIDSGFDKERVQRWLEDGGAS